MLYNIIQFIESSNKRACRNRFVNVTVVSRLVSNNNAQKLKANVKCDKRKLLKHLKKNNLNMKNSTQRKQEHTHVKNLKDKKTKDFLWRLKLRVGNWNEWPLSTRFSVLSGGRSG